MSIFDLFKKKNNNDLKELAEKELKENINILKSLRDYDQGKKEISTLELERRLPNIRVTP